MFLQILKSKIHRVQVTEANLEYIGSITIDEDLMDAAAIVVNVYRWWTTITVHASKRMLFPVNAVVAASV